jgi:SAM-dependent methyltransferase
MRAIKTSEARKPGTWSGRYLLHTNFLQSNRAQIKTFVDIDCGIMAGAPTTVDAKKALGKKTRVVATDIIGPTEATARGIKSEGIEFLMHDISAEPLPIQCDAARFANSAQWKTQADRRRALLNIWRSTKEGGFLLGATADGRGDHQFVLRKTARGWEEILLE